MPTSTQVCGKEVVPWDAVSNISSVGEIIWEYTGLLNYILVNVCS